MVSAPVDGPARARGRRAPTTTRPTPPRRAASRDRPSRRVRPARRPGPAAARRRVAGLPRLPGGHRAAVREGRGDAGPGRPRRRGHRPARGAAPGAAGRPGDGAHRDRGPGLAPRGAPAVGRRQPGGRPGGVTVSLDDVVRDALPALQRVDDVLAEREAPRLRRPRSTWRRCVAAAPDIVSAAAGAHRAQEAVAAIDTGALVPQLVGPVEELQDGMSQVAGALDAGAQVATLLPPMLGADGPRTYLLVSLNSAELRSAGGIVGAFAVLHAAGRRGDAHRPALDHRPEEHRHPDPAAHRRGAGGRHRPAGPLGAERGA